MYVCGPTVYDKAHIGNARPAVVFDVLYRILKYIYPKVTYVRNITDIDDKIYQAAIKKNVAIHELTGKNTKEYHEDISKLNVLAVDIEPKATEHIPDIIQFIEKLIENGNAYLADNHVYFDVSSFENYGKLSKKNIEELKEGARIEVSESKRNPMDFVLWKPVDEKFNFGWESPWGKGRPGWHIECSAMSSKYLGEIFDIHGGGIDLVFPHHENEIAQSCAINRRETIANYWMHNGHLNVNGTKMSKSLGSFFTVNELLEKFDGETLRMAFLMTHYASPMDFSMETLKQANNILNRWQNAIKSIEIEDSAEIAQDVLAALLDDMNTPKAIALLSETVDKINKGDIKLATVFINTCRKLLGILTKNPKDWFCSVSPEKKKWLEEKIRQRQIAKDKKDYKLADEIRSELADCGIIIEDTKNGVDWKTKL
jgi:cysteinyl-tRNA synthetase